MGDTSNNTVYFYLVGCFPSSSKFTIARHFKTSSLPNGQIQEKGVGTESVLRRKRFKIDVLGKGISNILRQSHVALKSLFKFRAFDRIPVTPLDCLQISHIRFIHMQLTKIHITNPASRDITNTSNTAGKQLVRVLFRASDGDVPTSVFTT